MRHSQNNRLYAPRRSAFAMVDACVGLGICLILAGLLTPAVQRARNVSIKLTCLSNLRHLAMATQQYHDKHGMLPGWIQTAPVRSDHRRHQSSFASIHAQLLPYLDRTDLYDRLNFTVRIPGPHAEGALEWAVNSSVAHSAVATFLCPADRETHSAAGQNSYRGNWGVGPYWARTAEFPDSANGAFTLAYGHSAYPLRFSHFYDGLNKTAMFSERILGSGTGKTEGPSDVLSVPANLPRIRTADALVPACIASERLSAPRYRNAGRYWIFTGLLDTLYTHAMPPNSRILDCQIFHAIPTWGAMSARSNHDEIVNLAFGDGSALSLDESIGLAIWRAIGTRDGGEVTPLEAF